MRLPSHLYDLKDSLAHGGLLRAAGYLMRLRIEYLLAIEERLRQPEEAPGIRRAMHAGALVSVVIGSYQGPDKRGDGFFYKELADALMARLVALKATLGSQEKHFANPSWWRNLDKHEAREELRANLERLMCDPETECLHVGIELQVLLDLFMRTCNPQYASVLFRTDRARYAHVRDAYDFLKSLLQLEAANAA
jgi:hypothetical protein